MVPAVTIVAIALRHQEWGAYSLTVGTVMGAVLEVSVLALALLAGGVHVLPRLGPRTPALTRVGRQYLPMMATAVVAGLAAIVDQAVASRLGGGGVATLNYGTRLVVVFLSVAGTALNTTTLPRLSQMAAKLEWKSLLVTLRRAGIIAGVGGLALTVALVLCSGLLVRLFFAGSGLTSATASIVNQVQIASFLRIPFALLLALLSGLIASVRANQLLLIATAAGVVANAGLDVALMRPLGVAGISLAGSLAQIVTFCVAAVLLHRRLGGSESTC
jgi:putative peptidoglycan lipid II flippase